MWLKCPGTFIRHFSQSARYPILNDRIMPGWSAVHELTVCLERVWPFRGEGVAGPPPSTSMALLLGLSAPGVGSRPGEPECWPSSMAELERTGRVERRWC